MKNLLMDSDSTTITRTKSSFDSSLKTFSDFNHTKKNFTSKLYDLKKQKKYTLLCPKTIKHLTKCIAYVVKSYSDNAKLKKNLESIAYHVFGKHENCDEWCKFKENPQANKPKNRPYCRYLTGKEQLFEDLKAVFKSFSKKSEKMINVGSTKQNESFHRTVASKNPKLLQLLPRETQEQISSRR